MISEDSGSPQDLPGAQSESQMGKGAKQIITKQVMNDILDYSRDISSLLIQELKSESRSIAAEQLNLASGKLDTFAEALTVAAEKLREQNSNSLADIVEIVSQNMMSLSKNLKESSPEKIIGEVEDFARRQSAIFLGAAVVTGILLGQLFSSSDKRTDAVHEFRSRKESSIEYTPGKDEEEYHERH